MFIGSLIDATTTAQSHGSSTEFRNLFDEFAEINFKYLLRQLKTRYKIIFIDPTRVKDWEISTIPYFSHRNIVDFQKMKIIMELTFPHRNFSTLQFLVYHDDQIKQRSYEVYRELIRDVIERMMRMLISKMKLSKIFVDEEFINILFNNREIQEIDGEDFYFTELNEVIRNIFMSEEGKELGKEIFAREEEREED